MNQILQKLALLSVIFSILISVGCQNKENQGPWKRLLPENSFDGWTKKGGDAEYAIENGVVTGKTVANTPNTFMATDTIYGDFILELDFKVDSMTNSGVQFRSLSFDEYQNGRVHGYQAEIDPSERAWTGGIYDEGRRRWLAPLEGNPEAQQAFKQGDWNHFRIEAIGDTLKTWINEVPASHLVDDKTSEGFIALQVHSVGKRGKVGALVQWKNIKIITDNVMEHSKTSSLQPVITKNNLTFQEKRDGWKMLWDGETTEGWRGAKLDSFPDLGWEIEDGNLIVLASGGGESEAGGDIVTREQYADFELLVDFKLTEGANSGIKYYVDTEINKGAGSSIGLEYQILDDERHPDAKLGSHEGSRTLASLYDLIAADTENIAYPIGEWNTAMIVSKDSMVSHYLNNIKVLEYKRGSDAFNQLVKESKYEKWPNFGLLEKGNILLQDHGDRVSFRNIKIKTDE